MSSLQRVVLACAVSGVLALTLPAHSDSGGAETDSARLTWMARDGSVAWAVPLTGEPVPEGAVPGELGATNWYPRLPPLELTFIEGGDRFLPDDDGNVLILDFWATWCEPCAKELAELQALGEEESGRGLEIVTVNMQEADNAARQFAWALNLKLPIARYTKAIHRALNVDSLPTAIVVDRRGRVRARWNGYSESLGQEIATLVRELLGNAEPPTDKLADVVIGGDELEIDWTRNLPGPADGLAFATNMDGFPEILIAAGREFLSYDRNGKVVDRRASMRSLGGLLAGDLDGKPGSEVVSVRRGGRVVTTAGVGEGSAPVETWEAPAPVLYTELLGSSTPGERGGILLATTQGIRITRMDGETVAAREDLGRVNDIAVTDSADAAFALLKTDGDLVWLDSALTAIGDAVPTIGGRHLVTSRHRRDAVGIATGDVRGFATGRILGGDGDQLAIVVDGGLAIFDLDRGRERFRADWPEIAHVASGDLDGDGDDELIVVSGRKLTVLRALGTSIEITADP